MCGLYRTTVLAGSSNSYCVLVCYGARRVSASSMIDHAIPPYSVRARVPRAMYCYTDYSDSTRLYIYRNR